MDLRKRLCALRNWLFSFKALLVILVFCAVWIPTIVTVVVSSVTSLAMQEQSAVRDADMILGDLYNVVFNNFVRAENYAKLVSKEIEAGEVTIEISRYPWLMDHFYNQISTLKATADLFLSEKGGRYIGRFNFNSQLNGWWETDMNSTLRTWSVDPVTNRKKDLLEEVHGFNVTQDIYYGVVTAAQRDCWTSTYPWQRSLFLTFGVITRAPVTHEFWGLTGTDYRISEVGLMFEGSQVPGGISMLIDASNMQVLSTTDPNIKNIKDDFTTPKLVNETEYPAIQETHAVAMVRFGSWANLYNQLKDGSTVTLKGDKSFISYRTLSRPCLSLVIAVITYPKVDNLEWQTLTAAGITTVAVVGGALVLALLIVRPLGRLSKEMHSITELKFSRSYSALSALSEFKQLDHTFGRLRQGIIAMTKYIPQQVVRDILSDNKERDLLGMAPRKLTILFTDIKGFTTISETLPRAKVVAMLNDWISAFTDIIHKNQGTVDKYIGDCIMAIWGAPLVVEKPESLACKAAMEFGPALDRLNQSWRSQGMPAIEVRVGLHCGTTLIGNIGCHERMNYTVCGNTANVSARLEQLGKTYMVSPIVSGQMYQKVKEEYLCVWLDTVVLRGHKVSVTPVYRLVAPLATSTRDDWAASSQMQAIEDALVNRSPVTKSLIDAALSDPAMAAYGEALRIHARSVEEGKHLVDRIRDGVVSAQSSNLDDDATPSDNVLINSAVN